MDNIILAHENARRGKRHYSEVRKVDSDPEFYLGQVQDLLRSGRFKTATYTSMTKQCSGKIREISKLPYFPDRIVHHCIVQVLHDIWFKTLIRDTYACIPGRGIHDGVRRIQAALRNKEETPYCLKMDVKKFYPSVDHEILKVVVRHKLKDPRVLSIIDEIIDSVGTGIPIGNYLSQHLGNLYLSGYDHWMKEHHRCRYYFRYCDDIVILGNSKPWLHQMREVTEKYLREELDLTLKANYQVFPVDIRGLDFLGYRFFRTYTLLRKSTAKNFKRKMRSIKKNWRRMPPVSVISSIMSYQGWTKYANCLHLNNCYIDEQIKEIAAQVASTNMSNPLE
jgi:retron-type reverse transcriptase